MPELSFSAFFPSRTACSLSLTFLGRYARTGQSPCFKDFFSNPLAQCPAFLFLMLWSGPGRLHFPNRPGFPFGLRNTFISSPPALFTPPPTTAGARHASGLPIPLCRPQFFPFAHRLGAISRFPLIADPLDSVISSFFGLGIR